VAAVTTDNNGLANIGSETVSSLAGEIILRLESDAPASVDVRATITNGAAANLHLVTQPSGLSEPDSTLRPGAKLQLVDDAGNGVPGRPIVAMLCEARTEFETPEERDSVNSGVRTMIAGQRTRTTAASILDSDACSRNALTAATLGGTTLVVTDRDGFATFSDLSIKGRKAAYRIVFGLGSAMQLETFTGLIEHDPEAESGRSTVVISAIKSIAGVAPENEFFDLRFMFRYTRHWFSLAAVDVSLTDRSTDTPTSTQKAVSDATMSFNYQSPLSKPRLSDGRYDRAVFAGLGLRVFRTLPYVGAHLGSLELGGSPFQGSMGTLGYYRRFDDNEYTIGEETLKAARSNLFVDFFVRSSTIAFFETLNIRGTLLLPIEKEKGIESRIAIAVPLGTVRVF
jgi:hypothetical protein